MDFVKFGKTEVPATYLGDAVYALYDGHYCILRLNDHRNKEGQIFLEPSVVTNLLRFIKECNQLRTTNERKESENLANTDNKQEG